MSRPTASLWEQCRKDFVFDGAWVDLVVFDSTKEDWDAFLTALHAGPFPLRCWRDQETIPVPESIEQAFAERLHASLLLEVDAGMVTAHCHFFDGDLELDIDPRQVTDASQFESVLMLMRWTAQATGRPIAATSEGRGRNFAFLVVKPDGSAEARDH